MATKKYIIRRLDTMANKSGGNKTKIDAINQCRRWLDKHWADMREPVTKEINRLSALLLPLVEEKKVRTFSEQEEDFYRRHLDTFLIYKAFYDMIYSTAWTAECERRNRRPAA